MLEVVEVELVPGLVVAGKWRLERPIGQGGFGIVWSAVELATGQTRALKCLTKEGASDAKRQERLRREARAMSGIDHPHIARVFGLEELPAGTPFFVMELLEGRTLYRQLTRGPMSVAQARGILIQIADALRTVHARGIIHRDLKPANVIIIDDRYAKVLDFGISKDLSSGEVKKLTTTGTALGTLNYMAPEQVFGERNLDPRCDIWALGVIAHECLTLRRPTDGEGDNSGQVLKAILDGNFPRLSSKVRDVPPDIDDLVARMLLRNAADRPTSEEVFTTLALPAISPTMRRSLRKDQLIATLPISDVPLFAHTIRDERFAGSQLVPSTVVPGGGAPTDVMSSAMAPTVMPSTAMPSTAMPSTVVPSTVVPSTRVPSTRVPSTHVPSTHVPSTHAPSTQVPSTVHIARDPGRPTPVSYAATVASPQHPSEGARTSAPVFTPDGYARAVEPRPPATTVVVDARARAARSRSQTIGIVVLTICILIGITLVTLGVLHAKRQDIAAREAASASAAAAILAVPPPAPASASASASAPASASASAPASASASAAVAVAPPTKVPSTRPAAPTVRSAPQTASAPPAKPPVTGPSPGPAAPPISNERF